MENLTNEQLIELSKNGNDDAFQYLFSRNIGFAHHIAHEFKNTAIEYDELISLCFLGMFKAYKYFKLEKSIKFLTFSRTCMVNEILMFIRKNKKKTHIVSLNSKLIIPNGNQLEADALEDTIVCERSNYEEVEEYMMARELIAKVEEKLSQSKRAEQKITIFKYVILYGLPQADVGQRLGIDQTRVSRVRKEVLQEIKKVAEEYDFVGGK